MKRNKWKLLSLALALVLLLSGCSAAPQREEVNIGYDAAAPMEPAAGQNMAVTEESDAVLDTGESGGLAGDPLASRKVIRDATLRIQTLEYDKFLPALEQAVLDVGGYVSSRYSSGNSYYGKHLRSAELEVRVPADRLDEFLTGVSGLGNVVDRRESLRDVTTAYVDTEAHLNALRTERDALLEILAAADTVEDLITVQNRLSDVQYEIESYEAVLRTYDDQIAMSTVTMYIDEVERETPVQEETFWQEVSRRFSESLGAVGEGFRTFGAWFFGNLPSIVVWVVILGGLTVGIVAIVRHSGKRLARQAAARQAETARRLRETQAAQAAARAAEPAAEQPREPEQAPEEKPER